MGLLLLPSIHLHERKRKLCSLAELKLTVFLVHQYFKRVHLIILKRQSHFFRRVLVCQLPVHEAAKQTGTYQNEYVMASSTLDKCARSGAEES